MRTTTRHGRPAVVTREGGVEIIEYLDGDDVGRNAPGMRYGCVEAGTDTMTWTERPAPAMTRVPLKVHPPGTPTKITPPKVRDDGEPSARTIVIRSRALADLDHTTFWGSGMDGKESGGLLLGYELDDDLLVVTNALNTAAARRVDSVKIDLEPGERADRNAKIAGTSPTLGMFHSHPNGDTRLSKADYQAFENGLGRAAERGGTAFVGLLAVPSADRGSLSRPDVYGWVTEYIEGAIVTRRAEVVID